MPEVDTSIYGKLGEGRQEPMTQIGNAVNIARGINENKLFNQKYNTNIGLGEAYKRSMGPDGQIDENLLTQNILRDPRTSWNLPEAMRAVQQQKQTKIQMDQAGLELAQRRQNILREGLSTFLDQPNPKKKDIIAFVGKLIGHNIVTPEQAAITLKDMPEEGPALKEALRHQFMLSLENEKRMKAIYGDVQATPTGGGTAFNRVRSMPRPGETGIEPAGQISSTVPPGTDIYDPGTRTTQKIVRGQPGQYEPPLPLDQIPGQRRTPAPMEQRGMPKRQDRIETVPAAPALGERTGAEHQAGSSGEQYGNDLRRASTFVRDVFPLTKAIPALERLGSTGTGPKTEQINDFKSFLLSVGMPGVDVNKIKDFDEARKYLTDWVNQNGNTGTNDKLAASFAGSPSVQISNAAAVDVAKAALALRRLQHAQVLAFEATGLPESQYTKWASKWQNTVDPRGFGVDFMSPKSIKALDKELKGQERERFINAYKMAQELGIINAR